MQNNLQQFVEFVLPKNTLNWFNIIESAKINNKICITLEEKNIPPVSNKKVSSKGFTDITITDFPIRGKQAILKFRRRYWQAEGETKLIKRNIKLVAEGTKLEKEFADFLKEDGGRKSGLTHFYRRVSTNPSQRI